MAVTPQRNNNQIVHATTGEITVANTKTNPNEVCQPSPQTLSSFTESTTLHGVRFMFTGNIFRRLLWTLALISCLGFCSYQVYSSLGTFYDRPFNTKITTKTAGNEIEELNFPAVTICNVNYINRRLVKYLLNRANFTKEEIELKLAVYAEIMAGSRDVFTDTETEKRHPELFHHIHGGKNVQKQNYLEIFGHRIEDMLLPSSVFNSCIINDMTCGSRNFTAFTTSMHNQCHTFNPGHEDSPIILATAAGHLNGLRLLLNVEKDSYLDNAASPIVGLRVLVHDQHTFPMMEQFSFAVRPGVRTLCSIKRKKVCSKV